MVVDRGLLVPGADDHLLDLVEEVHAVQPVCVLTGRPGLATEARCPGDVLFRQLLGAEDLIGVQRSDRDLGRSDQAHLVPLGEICLVAIEREKPRPVHRRFVHQDRHRHGHETFGDHPIRRQAQHRLVEHRTGAFEHEVPRPGDLHAAGDVDDAQGLTQLDVVLGLKVELADRTFPSDLDVGAIVAHRDVRRGRLGDAYHQLAEGGLKFADLLVELLDLALQLGDLRDGGLLGLAGEGCDLLTGRVLLGPRVLQLLAQVQKLRVDLK